MVVLKENERGFTLLEMLLALMIVSSAAFILLLKVPVNAEGQKLALATEQLLAEVRDTRQAALAENDSYVIKFNALDGVYTISRQGEKVKEIQLQAGIDFVGNPNNLTFNAAGRGAGMSIWLENAAGERKRVIVSPVGMRIRAE